MNEETLCQVAMPFESAYGGAADVSRSQRSQRDVQLKQRGERKNRERAAISK